MRDPVVTEAGGDIQAARGVPVYHATLEYRPDVVNLQLDPRQPLGELVPALGLH